MQYYSLLGYPFENENYDYAQSTDYRGNIMS